MKADRNRVDGQLDIFEAMNRAAAAVDRMMEEEKTGGKKGAKKKAQPEERVEPEKRVKQTAEVISGSTMHAAMQKTFLNPADGDFATVAYIEHRMVYFRDWNSPAALRRFENSKDAVEYYMKQLEKMKQVAGIEMTEEHEPFVDVKCVAENIYAECE